MAGREEQLAVITDTNRLVTSWLQKQIGATQKQPPLTATHIVKRCELEAGLFALERAYRHLCNQWRLPHTRQSIQALYDAQSILLRLRLEVADEAIAHERGAE